MIFNASDHARLATLFDGVWTPDGTTWAGPYPGYKPEVREAPNGDTKACAGCGGDGSYLDAQDGERRCHTCNGSGRVPNVDAGPAGKRYLHVAPKYTPPAWAVEYFARAHYEACRVAEALGVPAAYYPRVADGTLRVLEYPSAGHRHVPESPHFCDECGQQTHVPGGRVVGPDVCPALAPGAGTVEHTDFDLFTIVLWRSTPEDLELTHANTTRDGMGQGATRGNGPVVQIAPAMATAAQVIRPELKLHIGELGELVGLGPATPHRVPARPYAQKSIVYFAMPDHGAVLPARYVGDGGPAVAGATVGAWLRKRVARSRY